jgi:hypothetical protein
LRTFLRRLKGAAVNAAFWGVTWFGIGFVVDLALRLSAGGLIYDGVPYLWPTFFQALSTGVLGAAIGGGFSVFIATNFRRRRVEDVGPARFALGGALVTMLVVLIAGILMSTGQMVDDVLARPWELYADLARALLITGGLGGATAFGTIKLAQRGSELESLEAGSDRLLPEL